MGAAAKRVTEPADRVLKIERVFDAPRDLVFKAWTEPEHMSRWWGPRGFKSTVLNQRVGSMDLPGAVGRMNGRFQELSND